MTTGLCILFTALIVFLIGSVWVSINSVWAVERRVNEIGNELSAVRRSVMKVEAGNDYLLKELHVTTRWDNTTQRFIVVSVCNECCYTHNYPGRCCRSCDGSDSVQLGLRKKDIDSFKMKLDEIDRHVINTKV